MFWGRYVSRTLWRPVTSLYFVLVKLNEILFLKQQKNRKSVQISWSYYALNWSKMTSRHRQRYFSINTYRRLMTLLPLCQSKYHYRWGRRLVRIRIPHDHDVQERWRLSECFPECRIDSHNEWFSEPEHDVHFHQPSTADEIQLQPEQLEDEAKC